MGAGSHRRLLIRLLQYFLMIQVPKITALSFRTILLPKRREFAAIVLCDRSIPRCTSSPLFSGTLHRRAAAHIFSMLLFSRCRATHYMRDLNHLLWCRIEELDE
jgi:hypothetical protein